MTSGPAEENLAIRIGQVLTILRRKMQEPTCAVLQSQHACEDTFSCSPNRMPPLFGLPSLLLTCLDPSSGLLMACLAFFVSVARRLVDVLLCLSSLVPKEVRTQEVDLLLAETLEVPSCSGQFAFVSRRHHLCQQQTQRTASGKLLQKAVPSCKTPTIEELDRP